MKTKEDGRQPTDNRSVSCQIKYNANIWTVILFTLVLLIPGLSCFEKAEDPDQMAWSEAI